MGLHEPQLQDSPVTTAWSSRESQEFPGRGLKNNYYKSVTLIKAKLQPITNFAAQIYPASRCEIKIINDQITRYVVGNNTHITINELQQPKLQGGHRIPNFEIYADLMYVRAIKNFCRARIFNEPLSTYDCYVEYQIGLAMSDILGVIRLNNLPHAQKRSPFYESIIEIIKKYHLQPNELAGGKIRKAYDRIIGEKMSVNSSMINQWKRVHSRSLPSYLRTFNYRCVWNILPCHVNVGTYLTQTPVAPFCKIGPNAPDHFFYKCKHITHQWRQVKNFVRTVLNCDLTPYPITDIGNLRINANLNEIQDKTLTEIITTTRHQIWKFRNSCLHEKKTFSPDILTKNIKRALTIDSNKTQAPPLRIHPVDTRRAICF
ncbi:unnamed protein product [Clavelina lepadiformis]|uniref:Uncharacterized protein n=1 Tax=Clavelina lepadiformis TaxID=159417 RepID=A0ABP0FGC2_CLALP